MPSAEDSKLDKRLDEDAISVQSNPPLDESLDSGKPITPPDESPDAGKPTPPPESVSPPSPQVEKEARPDDKQPQEFKAGDTVGIYRIERMIGKGGMATVYRAFDTSTQRVVALKVLKKRFASSLKALARFDREFLALESLSHPNIVRVLDKGVENGANYFVMEYVDGASFSRLLRHRKLAFNTKAQILLQAAAALDYAHRKGIVHRDVKPDNILIDRTGRAKIADFGIAQITKSRLPLTSITVVSSFMGTADYMAPEQRVDAKSVDHRADIFSFGVMLYETFTGRLPIGNFSLPSQLNPEVSKRMDGIILRALRQNPAERYQSMAELADDLRRETQTSQWSKLAARMSLILQVESWKRVFQIRAIGAAGLFAVVLAALIWLLSTVGKSSPPSTDLKQAETSETPAGQATTEPSGESLPPQPANTPENMVYVPGGDFIMGSESEFSDQRPRHKVNLSAYFIDIYEVTNAEYEKFVEATGRPQPLVKEFWAEPFNWHNGTYPPGKGDHPVVLVSWNDAAAYAKWAGKRLPTEAEWERAARGADERKWPWGNKWEVDRCNTAESFLNSTQPAHSFAKGKSPFGCFNMAGNVMEWTADWFSESYYRDAPSRNPLGPLTGAYRVARGGAWDSNLNLYVRTSYRQYFSPDARNSDLGFRCAKDYVRK
ncbi:SUMF1/EgtB/PvdO family nonheme iron enzyme [Candidatus Poribacteria bacterium]|nr:SUMF1/EgtB/PvdO family nonheme iron enzyme [Candidatus Poribacteria bacterium]